MSTQTVKKQLLSVCMGSVLLMGYGTASVAAELTSITVTPINSTIGAGQTKQYTATGAFRSGATQDISTAGSFSATSSMGTKRESHSAIVLENGKVLISGGATADLVSDTAELYDPATETYTYTGNMASKRWRHTSTLLGADSVIGDGLVLITGGGGQGAAITHNTAELYNPDTDRFSPTNSLMTVPRIFHTATKLGKDANSKVLLVGGDTGQGYTATAELYDPDTKKFTATGSLTIPRASHSAVLLGDGTVLIVGGQIHVPGATYSTLTDTAELYDPVTNSFATIASRTVAALAFGTATLLNDARGRVLIAGGSNVNGVNSNKAQLYDPILRTFSETGNLTTPRGGHTANRLLNGKILLAGGLGDQQINSPELYDPASGVNGAFSATGPMSTGRNEHQAVLLTNGQVLVVGGFALNNLSGSPEYSNTAEHYTPPAHWSSSNASVAAISLTGLASSGTSPGEISIIATSGSASGISGSTSLLNSGSDLIVSALATPSVTINSRKGNKLNVGAQVKNIGNATASSFSVRYYLSTNIALDASDILTACSRTVTSLAGNNTFNPASGTTATSCAFPSTATRGGKYYVIAVADGNSAVSELDETNNSKSSTTTITAP